MRKTYFISLLSLILVSGFMGCEEEQEDKNDPNDNFTETYEVIAPENPVTKGERIYGINISDNKYGFESSFARAQEAGVEVVEINMPWNAIESSPGNYVDPGGNLAATAFYAAYDVKVCFSLALINTVAWEIPDYLKGVDVQSETFISAFTNMLDWLFTTIPSDVTIPGISIGNEVDLVLEGKQDWEDYSVFYQAVVNYIHSNHPEIKVGVKTTVMGGLFGHEESFIRDINQYSDVVMLNYYPQDQNFNVQEPTSVYDDIERITGMFSNKKIWFTELGYQSGSIYCNSSEAKQATFYHHFFTAWDTHQQDISFVLIDWLHDQAPEVIEDWKGYYGDSPGLVEYLSSLGLRNYDDTDKPAWLQVKEETTARGWMD